MDKRSGDPFAWRCLDDEQREIIHEWYEKVCESDRKKWDWEKRVIKGSGFFALLPFAAFIARNQMDGKLWEFLVYLGSGFLVCAFVYGLFSNAYYYFNYERRSEPPTIIGIVFQSIVAVFISLCILA